MHPDKSKVVYCKNSNRPLEYPQVQFTFLGFTFRPRGARSKAGKLFTGFLPAVSRDAGQLQRQTPATIEDLSKRYIQCYAAGGIITAASTNRPWTGSTIRWIGNWRDGVAANTSVSPAIGSEAPCGSGS